MRLICRLPTPARRKGRIEQAILRKYLESTSALVRPVQRLMANDALAIPQAE